jgi:hypothetical protein
MHPSSRVVPQGGKLFNPPLATHYTTSADVSSAGILQVRDGVINLTSSYEQGLQEDLASDDDVVVLAVKILVLSCFNLNYP